NLGFLSTPKGLRLAPIYDNPSALGLEQGEWLKAEFNPTGRIPTRDVERPILGDYVREFIRLGYEDQVRRFARRTSPAPIGKIIDEGFCSDLMKTALKKLVSKRIEELFDVLS